MLSVTEESVCSRCVQFSLSHTAVSYLTYTMSFFGKSFPESLTQSRTNSNFSISMARLTENWQSATTFELLYTLKDEFNMRGYAYLERF